MRQAVALLCSLALLAVSRPAVCTQAPPLKPGARVRLEAPSWRGALTGTLVVWEYDTLVVRVDGDAAGLSLIVPADSVTHMDVLRVRRMTLEGIGIGLLGGALLAVVASPECEDEYGDSSVLPCLAYQVSSKLDTRLAVLSGVGALVGAIVGSETKTSKWVPVQRAQLIAGPGPAGGLALGVRVSF